MVDQRNGRKLCAQKREDMEESSLGGIKNVKKTLAGALEVAKSQGETGNLTPRRTGRSVRQENVTKCTKQIEGTATG